MNNLASLLNNSNLGDGYRVVCRREILLKIILNTSFPLLSSVQNSERGKKFGNVMVTTSRNVVQTGKAVGKACLWPKTAWNHISLYPQHAIDSNLKL